MNAVDTNILAYSVDAGFPDKRRRALALIQQLSPDDTVLLWQVVCELGAVLTRFAQTGRTDADPAEFIHALRARYALVLPPEALVQEALRLRESHQLSYWDALLLAGCLDAGVTRLYTEDLQGKPVIDGVAIVNPLA